MRLIKLLTVIGLATAAMMTTSVNAAAPQKGVRLQDGIITYSAGALAGQVIPLGFDAYGYNYQAHMFSGSYFNSYANGAGLPPYEGDDAAYLAANPTVASHWAWPYRDVQLVMKWNDAWISNMDRDGDGKLDRHYGFPSYIGSGAWLTNHQLGSSIGEDGEEYNWNYFSKIVAVPTDAVNTGGIWYDASGTEIGSDIWGEFAIIQEVSNDQGIGDHGVLYHSPSGPGFGQF